MEIIIIALGIAFAPSGLLLVWGCLVAHARSCDPNWPAEEARRNAEEAQALKEMGF